jgi:hypothetical protein
MPVPGLKPLIVLVSFLLYGQLHVQLIIMDLSSVLRVAAQSMHNTLPLAPP